MSFYRTLLAAIEETTETAGAEILSHCRREEVVESRRLFVLIAKEYGATNDAIANFLRITPAGVRSIFYNKKVKGKLFEINHTKIKKKLESNHVTITPQK